MPVLINSWSAALGPWTYVLLFLVVFAETGLVILPLLPGDSLLFAVGAICAIPESSLQLGLLMLVLSVAAILGDALNYSIGNRFGGWVAGPGGQRWVRKEYLVRAQEFYKEHGGKTIVLARFMPIIRTYAPFVAGVAKMRYLNFASYNVLGGVLWTVSFLAAGYFFGNIPEVKTNFHIVILAIAVISLIPAALEAIRARRNSAVSLNR